MFDGGAVKIYRVSEICEPGGVPVEGLYTLFAEFHFEERSIGMTRNYMAMQSNAKIDRLIRIWQDRYIKPDFICTINDGIDNVVDGVVVDAQYRIARVEHLDNGDGLKITDLTLERLDDLYEIS